MISYNTREMTLDCLASSAAETTVPLRADRRRQRLPDGSAAAIAAAFPGIRLIASRENHGFAKGNNLAGAEARGEYILLLNPDTVVLDHAIDRLVVFAERTPRAGIWGGRTLFGDGSLNPTSVFADLTLWSLFCRTSGLAIVLKRSTFFNPEGYGAWDRSTERDVDVVQGSFFLIRRDLWERIGGFDLTFVMYGEEADLCRRARAVGAQPRMTPEATIIHYHGAASKTPAARKILTLKAKSTMIRRHLPGWQQRPALFLLRMWPWTRMVSGGTLARLTGRTGLGEAAERWGTVWKARADWLPGYPPQPGSSAS